MKELVKSTIRAIGLKKVARKLLKQQSLPFDSQKYWKDRYKRMIDSSGAGSYGRLAQFKAEVLNKFVTEVEASDIIELGSGDGHQLTLSKYPKYTGFDISKNAVEHCRARFSDDPTKDFFLMSELNRRSADVAISLDVIYHLIEEHVFESYMDALFGAAKQYVVVYSSNTNDQGRWVDTAHVKHRCFTDWVEKKYPHWRLVSKLKNRYPFDPNNPNSTSFSDFFFFERTEHKTV